MDIFVSWSGPLSKSIAHALHGWLPLLFHDVEVFVSSRDIQAGARWSVEIAERLERTSYGIICVTSENQEARWLNFEAGAIAKTLEETFVTPLAINLQPSEIKFPLGQFQSLTINRADVFTLVQSINRANAGVTLPSDRLETIFGKFWPDLESEFSAALERAANPTETARPERSDSDMLQEVVVSLRAMGSKIDRLVGSEESGSKQVDSELRRNILRHLSVIAEDVAPGARLTWAKHRQTGEEAIRVLYEGNISDEARGVLNGAAEAIGVRLAYGKLIRTRSRPAVGGATT